MIEAEANARGRTKQDASNVEFSPRHGHDEIECNEPFSRLKQSVG
jgi:hypothetical protein